MLRALRREARLTQEGLAHLAGLHVRTIRGLETGRITKPRRGSLDLLGQALALDVGRQLSLLSAWGIRELHRPTLDSRRAGSTRIESIEAFLSRSQRDLRIVTLNELVIVGDDRRTKRRATQEVVLALRDGVDSRPVFYDPDDDAVDLDRFRLAEMENCTVRREILDVTGRAKMLELQFIRPLREGETQILHYSVDFTAARDPGRPVSQYAEQEVAGFLRSPASYVLEIRFEGVRPSRCAQIFQARPTGPVVESGELTVTSTNSVHLALLNPKPGGHGIAWSWDE